MRILYDEIPSHADACVIPLRKDLIAMTKERPLHEKDQKLFTDNEIEIGIVPNC